MSKHRTVSAARGGDFKDGALVFSTSSSQSAQVAWRLTLECVPESRVPCVAAPDRQVQGATTMAYPLWYVEEERRRRWRPAAATSCLTIGWADLRRRAALLVGCVLNSSTRPSSRLARLASGPSAGHGRFWDALLMVLALSPFAQADAANETNAWRDPFTFGARTETVSAAGQVLAGVLWDSTHPLAMIGQGTVGVGDYVGNWRVVEIRQDGVVVQSAEQRTFVSVGGIVPAN